MMKNIMGNEVTRSEFSNSESYVMEQIPDSVGMFQRKQWIKEKMAMLGHQKAVVFVEKSKIMWAFLNEEQSYWMPVEKAKFFLHVFEDNGNCCLISEKTANGEHYYGMVDNFLVVYTKDYAEAMENINKYSNGRKIEVFGVGDVVLDCDKKLSCAQVNQKIGQKVEETEINDDLIYLNEDHDQKPSISYVSENIDDAFYHWFDNAKNKVKYKRKCVIGALLTGIFFFSIADIYFAYNNAHLRKEIDVTLQKMQSTSNKI